MEYYVIRVYRREASGEIVGFIENVATGKRGPFRDPSSLWHALADTDDAQEVPHYGRDKE